MRVGKHYAEFHCVAQSPGHYQMFGLIRPDWNPNGGGRAWQESAGTYDTRSRRFPGNETFGAPSATTGDKIGILLDLTRGSVQVFKNGEPVGMIREDGATGPLCWYVETRANGDKASVVRKPLPGQGSVGGHASKFYGCSKPGQLKDDVSTKSGNNYTLSLAAEPLVAGTHSFTVQCDSEHFHFGVIDSSMETLASTDYPQMQGRAGYCAEMVRGSAKSRCGGNYVISGSIREGSVKPDPAGFELNRQPATMVVDMDARTLSFQTADRRGWVIPGLPASVLPVVNIFGTGTCRLIPGAAVLKWAASGSAVCIRHEGDVLWWSTSQGWQPSSEGGMSRIVGDFDSLPLATAAQIASQCKGNLP